mmetsp:Transcript_72446/g.160046  ORF Transcript_72446/g.160046 Transcript_72446/m.160046 type:complete len:211 (-) Transcript_72446:823-1455(-)
MKKVLAAINATRPCVTSSRSQRSSWCLGCSSPTKPAGSQGRIVGTARLGRYSGSERRTESLGLNNRNIAGNGNTSDAHSSCSHPCCVCSSAAGSRCEASWALAAREMKAILLPSNVTDVSKETSSKGQEGQQRQGCSLTFLAQASIPLLRSGRDTSEALTGGGSGFTFLPLAFADLFSLGRLELPRPVRSCKRLRAICSNQLVLGRKLGE